MLGIFIVGLILFTIGVVFLTKYTTVETNEKETNEKGITVSSIAILFGLIAILSTSLAWHFDYPTEMSRSLTNSVTQYKEVIIDNKIDHYELTIKNVEGEEVDIEIPYSYYKNN